MRDRRGRRRRSKSLWIREMTSREKHIILNTLARKREQEDLTAREEWVWDQILVELAYWRSHVVWTERCTCWFCTPTENQWKRDYSAALGDDPTTVEAPWTELRLWEPDDEEEGGPG